MVAALLLAGAAMAASGGEPVLVAPLRATVPPSMEIGNRGAGWTCFPAGAIRWRDLMFEQDAAAEAVARSLSLNGVPANADAGRGVQSGGPPVLTGTVRSTEASACSPQHGLGKLIGGKTKLKGRMVLTISWIGRQPGATAAEFETRSEVDVSLHDPDLRSLLEAGLTQVGVDAAREWRRLPAD